MRPKWMLVRPWGPNCLILEAKTFKISPKRLPKSLKYRGCGADAFLERSWAPKGCSHVSFPGPFWEPFSVKNRKNVIQKGMQNSMPKKYRKLMAKGSQNDTKIDAKIDENSYFSEKGWNARNYLFYNRKRGSEHLKMHEKSIQNRCKIDARKSDAKSMENDTKMHPKWEPKSIQNLKNTRKKRYPKIDTEIWCQKNDFFRLPQIFADFECVFWPCRGVRGAEDTWKYQVVNTGYIWRF